MQVLRQLLEGIRTEEVDRIKGEKKAATLAAKRAEAVRAGRTPWAILGDDGEGGGAGGGKAEQSTKPPIEPEPLTVRAHPAAPTPQLPPPSPQEPGALPMPPRMLLAASILAVATDFYWLQLASNLQIAST